MSPTGDEPLLTIADWERAASARLSPLARDYYRSGADDERTLARNRETFVRQVLWPRVLVDVAAVDLATTLLGTPVAHPILVAPTAAHRLAHPDGELATARGSAAAGALFVVSTLGTTPLDEVARASDGPKWFQLYIHRDRGLTRSLVERAAAAGYRALVLTVDTPRLGRRLVDERNGFHLPPGLGMANLTTPGAVADAPASGSQLAAHFASRHDPTVSWRDLDELRALSSLPLVLKGILRPDDARRAVAHGVDGLIVSNHGGRQLDGAPATLDALPRVVDAVAGRCEVYVDGGVRSGTDALAALAHGARAILVGRPVLWGLAVDGAAGVERVLRLLASELEHAMVLAGCPSLAAVDGSLLDGGW